MIDLFKWGFVVGLVSTWLAIGIGAVLLLVPLKHREQQSIDAVERKRAA